MMWILRKAMSSLGMNDATELIIDRLKHTKSNVSLEIDCEFKFAESIR